MKAILFDLDDTLYPELDFVKSGFRAVANYLSNKICVAEEEIFINLLTILENEGRGNIFDQILKKHDVYSDLLINTLVYIYRSHKPNINLYSDTLEVLNHFRQLGNKIGIITDGMASVQRRKMEALGISGLFDVIICSDEIGPDCYKPSLIPYMVALNLLEVEPSDSIYVGDNISKDFKGANQLGLLTIQICRKCENNLTFTKLDDSFHARYMAKDLKGIFSFLGNKT